LLNYTEIQYINTQARISHSTS